jgi:toxin ParE1/3/4
MPRVTYSRQAKEDLINLWLWIARDRQNTADTIIDRIERRVAMLADFPEMGPARPEIGEGARSLVIERWLILYRRISSDVQIARVIDAARDLDQLEWPKAD